MILKLNAIADSQVRLSKRFEGARSKIEGDIKIMVEKMKVWQLAEWGKENLQVAERDVPRPGPNDVLVRVRAASLNDAFFGVATIDRR